MTTGLVVLSMVGVLFLNACSNTSLNEDIENESSTMSEPLKVVTTIPPLYSFTSHLVEGTNVEVTNLLPANTSIHTFQLTPSLVKEINESDLLVINGLDLELFLEDVLADYDGEIVTTSEGLDLISYDQDHEEEDHHDEDEEHDHEEEEHHDEDEEHGHEEEDHHDEDEEHDHEEEDHHDEDEEHDHEEEDHHDEDEEHDHEEEHHDEDEEHDHHHGEFDPHVWLSPKNAKIQSKTILEALVELDPENEDIFRDNYQELEGKINDLEVEVVQAFNEIEIKSYIVFHDAYRYFENYYGLEAAAHLEEFPGDEPSVEYLAEVIEIIEDENVEVIFSEPQFSPKLVETLSSDYELKVGELDPLGTEVTKDSYFEMMRKNYQEFEKVFNE